MSSSGAQAARTWTVRELLSWSRDWFERRGVDNPRLTGEVLLASVLQVPRIKLYVDIDRPLEKPELARYRDLVQRRAAGEPTQYLVGEREFYGRSFRTDRRALIPRPETELVVERVLREIPADAAARVLDVGCGTGCIGLTVAAERKAAAVLLLDVSPDAAALAAENAQRLGLADRVQVRTGDLFAPAAGEVFDVVVANLPYIPSGERNTLPLHIREHEPAVALFGGEDGLDIIRRAIPQAVPHLRPGGLLVLEHGAEHGPAMRELFPRDKWEEPVVESDLAGFDRFTWAKTRA